MTPGCRAAPVKRSSALDRQTSSASMKDQNSQSPSIADPTFLASETPAFPW
jgi:hypothetical protein